MNVLDNKRILLFSQYFFGYENKIAKKYRDVGAEISLYDEMSVKKSFDRALLKISPQIFMKRTEDYYLDILNKEKKVDYDFVLFIDCEMPTVNIIKKYREAFSKAKFCLHMWDSVQNLPGVMTKFDLFDRISTFDRRDAEKYHIVFRPLFFCDEYRNVIKVEEPKYDLSFIGTIHSDRYAIIEGIKESSVNFYTYPYLQSKFIYHFYKLTKREFKRTKADDFKYEKISSTEIARVVNESKAVLDVQHPKQSGLTIRTIEMLGMKKKLVTTNQDIINYDFYNPNNICVIDRKNPVIPDGFYASDYMQLNDEMYEFYSIDRWILDVLGLGETYRRKD